MMPVQTSNKYCVCCGAKNKILEDEYLYYDKNTGEKKKIYYPCNKKDCKHGFHQYKRGLTGYGQCEICGEMPHGSNDL